jgi:glycogen debranching enzyme
VVRFRNEGATFKTLYLAIMVDGGEIEQLNDWLSRSYSFDKERNSFPYERSVFKALRLHARRVVFSVSEKCENAIAQARYIFNHIPLLETHQKKECASLKPKRAMQNKEVAMAYFCSRNALSNLLVSSSVEKKVFGGGLYAGLPWFFQFWARDEAISLKALGVHFLCEAKAIALQRLGYLDNGIIQDSADGALWLFKRLGEFIKEKRYTRGETAEIKRRAEETIAHLLKTYTKEDFALTGSHKTWMDSIERGGARIEMQALRLALYNLASSLNGVLNKQRYRGLEERLRDRVRKVLWNGKFLADGFDPSTGVVDDTITPNIFLAAYSYPSLLERSEWIVCFDTIIPKLWLQWGGFATINTESQYFHPFHTGEVSESYHKGDSWFWINNLAALVLYRFDKIRYKQYIDTVVKASTEEVLWHGIIGYHAELSSAAAFASQGCLAQSWSSALYCELVEGVFRKYKSNYGHKGYKN